MQYCRRDASRVRPRRPVGGRPRGRRSVLHDRVRICAPARVRALAAPDSGRHAHASGRVPARAVRALGVGRRGSQAATPIEAHATRGYNHFALRSADIDALWERAIEAGASAVMPPADLRSPASGSRSWPIPEGNLVELVAADGEARRQGGADHRDRRRPGRSRGAAVRRRGRHRVRVRSRRRAGRGGGGGDPRGRGRHALARRRSTSPIPTPLRRGSMPPPSAPAGSTSSTTTPRRRGWGRSRS